MVVRPRPAEPVLGALPAEPVLATVSAEPAPMKTSAEPSSVTVPGEVALQARLPATPSPPPSSAGAVMPAMAGPPAVAIAKPASAEAPPPRAASPIATLAAHPERFDLDQAAFVIARGRDAVSLPYTTTPRLGLPLAEVTSADPKTGNLASPLFGLIGPGGSLPRHYTATTGAELRRRSRALHAFLDMLARRFTGMWVRAGAKYRPARDPVPAERALDAVIGMGTPNLAPRIAVPAPSLRYHAGHLAARTRSAERLRAMLAEEAGSEVEIVEFAGGWLRLPPSEQSRIGVVHGRLGMDAAVGAQVWDSQARFIIRLGPLSAAEFERLLPGRPLFERLCGLTRLFVGPEQDFALNPILAAHAVPAARAGEGGGRLGLTAWMAQPAPRRRPAADALLRPTPL